MTITQHAHIYGIPTSNFNFRVLFLYYYFINCAPNANGPWPPPGRYGVNTHPMVASSGI